MTVGALIFAAAVAGFRLTFDRMLSRCPWLLTAAVGLIHLHHPA